MRIGMITQWYEPETASAAHSTAVARALAARGHEVKVLTGFPSYPLGRVYDGYTMRPRLHENRDGVQILRVPDAPSHDRSAVRRALSLTSFAASATAQVGWLRDVDVCLTYLTPATVGLAAMTLRRVWGVPYAVYVQDLWPETITASGFIGNPATAARVERLLNRWLRRLYAGADGVAAISPTMAETLAARGATVSPVSIPNWVDERIFAPVARSGRPHLDDRRWVMYAGGLGEVQALDTALRALALVDDPDLALALVGTGVALPALERLAGDLRLGDRVRFLGRFPMEQMPALMAEADAQLVSLKDLPLFRGTIPSKLQSSMACGLPIVCSVAGDAAALVRRSGCGFTANPEDPGSLAEAFRQLAGTSPEELTAMGSRARSTYVSELGEESGAAVLEELLAAAAARRSR
ncbi:glycosyltransferase family 4 protein [Nocardioides cynanchi]|uniref:glycosyltransferase family 4 protein n=1 Tax=Nocardioides cynanchi TaxID=2558918 RepID=UPI001248F67F|nr:glycosyltransferase family 4 protein [Nocardioides cynanchi]